MKSNTLNHISFQNSSLPLVLIALAGCSWANVTLAEDTAGSGASAGSGSSAAQGSGTTGDGASGSYRTGQSSRSGDTSKKSPFAYNTGDSDLPKTPKATYADAEAQKAGRQMEPRDTSESQIVAPSFYGHGPQVITPGLGQFARPKYRYGISVGIGYDDNPNQTANVNLSVVGQPRVRTGFTNVNGHWDAQWLKPRTVFTINLEGGGDFYWDRPGNTTDGNVRLGILYVEKIDPLTQFTANASFAYLSQPDYSNLYASASQVAGDYFTASTKFDLNHRWAPLFSTTTSASVNVLKYTNESPTKLSNSYWSFIFGNEFRFQSSPRLTWIAEGRYGLDEYISNSRLNAQTAYALGGVDWLASRHLTTSIRAGASFRTFDAGGSSNAPYVEASMNYLVGRHSTLTVNGRYGFEQSNTAGDENVSYRLGVLYQQAFTSRFSGNTGINFIHTNFNPRQGATTSTDIFDVSVGVQYRLDRHFALSARYSYTFQEGASTTGSQDFDRNRVLVSAQYEF